MITIGLPVADLELRERFVLLRRGEASALGVDKTAIDEYEKLVRQVFAVLGAPWQEKDPPRKPLAKLLPIGNGVSVETRPFGGVSGRTS